MNKIIKEHYPVSRLPADLREGLADWAFVNLEIVENKENIEKKSDIFGYDASPRKLLSAVETVEEIRKYQAENLAGTTAEEAVARIRQLRDEWDGE